MSGYLLDTNVASEACKRRRANRNVLAWLETIEDSELFLSVLVLGEIREGVELVRQTDPRRARALERWLGGLKRKFADRLLPVNAAVADRRGRLSAIRPTSTVDGLLVATALVHGMTLVTRNERHVAHTGVRLLNPFED